MKQSKILVTVGYPEMAQKFRDIAKELNIEITIVEGVLEEAANEVTALIEKDNQYEAVISRAGTAKILKERITLPVIHHDSDHFDLVESFLRAKELGDQICFITYSEQGYLFDFKKIQNALPFPIKILPYQNSKELFAQIKKAKSLHMDVVVGGGIRAAQITKSLNMKPMYLTSSERNIRRALTLASQIALDRLEIKQKAEVLRLVINAAEDGVLYIDFKQRLVSCNTVAEQLFKIQESQAIGKTVDTIFIDPVRREIIKKLIHEKKEITHQKYHYTAVPLIVDMESIGTVIICKEIRAIQNLEKKIRRDINQKGLVATYKFNNIIHQSQTMKDLISLAKNYAQNDATILIIGESGTGKEVFAQSIHNESNKKDGPFVALNCAALPENILENELFGHVEGAFTGALKNGRAGVFELAHGGTIFLDEIGEIPLHIQTRLLRVLQERNVMRIGADYITPVDIRVIAATNKNLWQLVLENKFRLDLYFRLSVLHLKTPALKERKDDIPLLVNHLLQQKGINKNFSDCSPLLQQFFLTYDWPGNIRQLENIIERYSYLPDNPDYEEQFLRNIQIEMIPAEQSEELVQTTRSSIDKSEGKILVEESSLKDIEIQLIQYLLKKYNNNKSLVAEILQISRTTLWKKLAN